jgi:hypothetical protein
MELAGEAAQIADANEEMIVNATFPLRAISLMREIRS